MMKGLRETVASRWQQLSARDRRALTILGGVAMPVLFFGLLYLPTWQRFQQADVEYLQSVSFHQSLMQHGPRLMMERLGSTSANQLSEKVQGFAQTYALSVLRIEANGDTVRVNLNANSMRATVQFLEACRLAGIAQDEVVIKSSADGVYAVKVRLSLRS